MMKKSPWLHGSKIDTFQWCEKNVIFRYLHSRNTGVVALQVARSWV